MQRYNTQTNPPYESLLNGANQVIIDFICFNPFITFQGRMTWVPSTSGVLILLDFYITCREKFFSTYLISYICGIDFQKI